MTKFHSVEVSQKDATKFFLGGPPNSLGQSALLDSEDFPEEMSDGACLLLWDQDVPVLPYAIVAEKQTLSKVLPKLMSLPSLGSPATNLFRAWDLSDLKGLNRRNRSGGSERLGAFVGLIVGELVSRIGPHVEIQSIASSSARRTLAHVLATLQINGADDQETDKAISAWLVAAEITETQVDHRLVRALSVLSSFIRSLPLVDRIEPTQLGKFIRTWMFDSTEVDTETHKIVEHLMAVAQTLKGASREERFEAAIAVVDRVRRLPGGPKSIATPLLAGYACSLIEPGSLEFLRLCFEIERDFEQAGIVCSYAMCTALFGGRDFLLRASGFGLHVILAGLRQPRPPDVSIHELEILSRSFVLNEFSPRTSVPSLLEVELIPNITGAFFVKQKRSDVSESKDERVERLLNPKQLAEFERVCGGLEEMAYVMNRLRESLTGESGEIETRAKKVPKRR